MGNRQRRCWGRAAAMAAALLLLLMAVRTADAQQPTRPGQPARPGVPADTVAGDTVPGDTVPGDTVPGDTVPGATEAAEGLPPDPAADSVLAELRKLRGYVATEYRGQSAIYQANQGVLRLVGADSTLRAEVSRTGDRLAADTIVYNSRTELVDARGNPVITGSQVQELKGNSLVYDLANRRATALGARTQVSEGANWLVRGDISLESAGQATLYATRAHFTTCDLEIPHYHFEADEIKVVKDRLLVARPARLYFGNVPVMVLPFIVQNLERGRRSGLLVPKFSLNDIVRTNSGYTRQISDLGWYWAINDYLGAQLTGSWRSEAYTALQGSVDWNWRRQFLNGGASFRQYWEANGGTNFNMAARSSWKPDERTDLALDANFATSSRFIREVSFDPREVTQDLASNFRISRRFDWGSTNFGADRRQSIADGSVTGTLPSFAISPNTFTLFRARTEAEERWYSNTAVQLNLSGTRTFTENKANVARGIQDATNTRLQGGLQQFSIGNFNLSATGQFNQALLEAATGMAPVQRGAPFAGDSVRLRLPGRDSLQAQWQASLGYQQNLIGQTVLTPNLSLSQDYITYALPDSAAQRLGIDPRGSIAGARRVNFGASLSTALFGRFPGVGPYSAIRHRVSPSINYYYSPAVEQDPIQARVFGRVGGLNQNVVSLTLNQTFEAKLREPQAPTDSLPSEVEGSDTTQARAGEVAAPSEPQKVTILSISTSAIQFDFAYPEEQGSRFRTERISNSISSDYLKGLNIQMEHELFDRSGLDPALPDNRGRVGTFAPRLSSLSTGFELGPESALFRWLGNFLGPDEEAARENPPTQGVIPGTPPSDEPNPSGTGAFTGNPQGVGGGPWRSSLQYSFSRPPRLFNRGGFAVDDRAIQTVSANTSFALSPNWSVSWTTDYSITDNEFGSHRLNFKRDLHRWQANFNFYKTPNGNAAFEFFVELTDNPDLKFDYRERNLGIDRRGAGQGF